MLTEPVIGLVLCDAALLLQDDNILNSVMMFDTVL